MTRRSLSLPVAKTRGVSDPARCVRRAAFHRLRRSHRSKAQ
jgi:hypothetical protein